MTFKKYFGSTIGKTGASLDMFVTEKEEFVTEKEESRIIPRI